jgi:hypothetical protein
MQFYIAAIIKLILDDLIDQQHAQFFKIKALEKAEAMVQNFLKGNSLDAQQKRNMEAYRQSVLAHQQYMELMAILAISLSLQEKISVLEKHKIKIFTEISEKIQVALKDTFDNLDLKDIHGNTVILNAQQRKNIVDSLIKDYIDDFTDYCIKNNTIPADRQQKLKNSGFPGLQGHQDKNNNSFEKFYNQHHENMINKFSSNIKIIIKDNNVSNTSNNSKKINFLAKEFKKELKNQQIDINEAAKIGFQIKNKKYALNSGTEIENNLNLKNNERKNEINIF